MKLLLLNYGAIFIVALLGILIVKTIYYSGPRTLTKCYDVEIISDNKIKVIERDCHQ